jgi:hypothetical protein
MVKPHVPYRKLESQIKQNPKPTSRLKQLPITALGKIQFIYKKETEDPRPTGGQADQLKAKRAKH